MSPRSELSAANRRGDKYHITVAYVNRLPRQAWSVEGSHLNRVRRFFRDPIRTTLRVAWVDIRTSVARVAYTDPLMSSILPSLVHLRTHFGGHPCQDLIISM